MTGQRLGLGPSCVTLGLERRDADNDAAGLSREDRITVLLGGYAGELCLYDWDDIAGKGVFFTRLTRSADDAAGVARILGRPRPNTVPEVERRLVEALIGVRHRPYALLARDLVGFRYRVSRLHAAWEHVGFRSVGLRADSLPDAARSDALAFVNAPGSWGCERLIRRALVAVSTARETGAGSAIPAGCEGAAQSAGNRIAS